MTNATEDQFSNRLQLLSAHPVHTQLTQINRGIEKEGLRVTPEGQLALSPHPHALGSALTNGWLTTDFSESLLEFITPVQHSAKSTLHFLTELHNFASTRMGNELIWATSMPCILPADTSIPLAQYGSSNIGTMKTAYRRGLGHRYGRAMQTVAGIHYNFSLPEQYWQLEYEAFFNCKPASKNELQSHINKRYLDLIRNFRRNYWILIYLFGAAPCVDKSFVQGRAHNLEQLSNDDLYLPYSTSLRMGDLGYQSNAQKSLFVCYNELDNYLQTLNEAMQTTYAHYESFGLNKDGVQQQLSTALLQIENEFYSPIRPKRVTDSGETPLHALATRGIEYIEVRCIDINPFHTLGIDEPTIHFIDAFLMTCLLKDSPLCDPEEFALIGKNQSLVVNQGRQPNLKVYCGKQEVPMQSCAEKLLDQVQQVALQLDTANASTGFSQSVALQRQKVNDPSLTPSAKVCQTMQEKNQSHIDFALAQSQQHTNFFKAFTIDKQRLAALTLSAEQSHQKQKEVEQADNETFEQFLKHYYAN